MVAASLHFQSVFLSINVKVSALAFYIVPLLTNTYIDHEIGILELHVDVCCS